MRLKTFEHKTTLVRALQAEWARINEMIEVLPKQSRTGEIYDNLVAERTRLKDLFDQAGDLEIG